MTGVGNTRSPVGSSGEILSPSSQIAIGGYRGRDFSTFAPGNSARVTSTWVEARPGLVTAFVSRKSAFLRSMKPIVDRSKKWQSIQGTAKPFTPRLATTYTDVSTRLFNLSPPPQPDRSAPPPSPSSPLVPVVEKDATVEKKEKLSKTASSVSTMFLRMFGAIGKSLSSALEHIRQFGGSSAPEGVKKGPVAMTINDLRKDLEKFDSCKKSSGRANQYGKNSSNPKFVLRASAQRVCQTICQMEKIPEKFDEKDFKALAEVMDFLQITEMEVGPLGYTIEPRRQQQFAEDVVFRHRPQLTSEMNCPWLKNKEAMQSIDQAVLGMKVDVGTRVEPQDLCRISSASGLGHLAVDSSTLTQIPNASQRAVNRSFFKENKEATQPLGGVAQICSTLVPPGFLVHGSRDIGDRAQGVKHESKKGLHIPGTGIRNPEGLFRYFFTANAQVRMGADIGDVKHGTPLTKLIPLGDGQYRQVIVSNQINLDFENRGEGLYQLAQITGESLHGKALTDTKPMSFEDAHKASDDELKHYDDGIISHLVFHLFPGGVRPSLEEVKEAQIMEIDAARQELESLIRDCPAAAIPERLKNMYVKFPDAEKDSFGDRQPTISLYCLLMICLHQARNEGNGLESMGRPYANILRPSFFFAGGITGGLGSLLHNRLRCLAYKCIGSDAFKQLSEFYIEDALDPGLTELFKKVFGDKAKSLKDGIERDVQNNPTGFKVTQGHSEVDHNNGDQHASNGWEGGSSQDGLLMQNGDARWVLERTRPELLQNVKYASAAS